MGPAGMSLNWREEPRWCVCVLESALQLMPAESYLLDNVSDGKQLLGGVSCLVQGRVVVVAGHHRAEPGVQVGACRAVNTQALNSDSLTNLKKAFFKK